MSPSNRRSRLAPQFHAYAADVFKRKLDLSKSRSAAGRSKWSNIVDKHLVPAFGDLFVDQLRPREAGARESRESRDRGAKVIDIETARQRRRKAG